LRSVRTPISAFPSGAITAKNPGAITPQSDNEGVVASNAEIAEREGLHRSTVNKLLPLALLAPDLVEAMLAGRQPRALTLLWLQRHPLPNDWQGQRKVVSQFE
jgi:hypothetical protein